MTKPVATLARLAELAVQNDEVALTGRSHNVAAQMTTLGKRFATFTDELLTAFDRLESLLDRYPLRGIKGPSWNVAGHAGSGRWGCRATR